DFCVYDAARRQAKSLLDSLCQESNSRCFSFSVSASGGYCSCETLQSVKITILVLEGIVSNSNS
ncbi:unnamed protein product, partial [Amoebophrya sp. A120]